MLSIIKPDKLFLYIIFISLPLIFHSQSAFLYPFLGIIFFIIISFDFIFKLSQKIVIKELIALIALLQWIVAPILSYLFQLPHSSYGMIINIVDYFDYVFPGTLIFVFALYLPIKSKNKKKSTDTNNKIGELRTDHRTGIFLITIGFLITFISPFVPASLSFLVYLIANLKFVGLYYILFSRIKGKIYWVFAIMGLQLISSIATTMYHNLFLWAGFFFIVIAYFKKLPNIKNYIYLLVFLIIIFLIQSVKVDYRAQKNRFDISNPLTTFFTLIEDRLTNFDLLFSAENFDYQITRINQGWIIARIMNYVPNNQPFAKGSTILVAIEASIYPRFILTSKVQSGGQDYFELYTGRKLYGASMDLSTIGEAYANFNVFGGIIFMFLWGLFLNLIIQFILNKAFNYPTLLLWIPFLFLQVVKAETDFATALNHLTKAALLTWLFFSPFIKAFFSLRTLRKY